MIPRFRAPVAAFLSIVCAFILAAAPRAVAQPARTDSARFQYGVFGAAGLNQHDADFRALPGVPNCCPRFGHDNGFGYGLGALVDFPLTRVLLLELRAGYEDLSAKLSSTEGTTIIVDNAAVDGEFEHTIDTRLNSVGIEPLLMFRMTRDFSFHAGLRGALILTKTFDQVETITKPADRGVFTDTRLRTRNAVAGDIPNAKDAYVGLVAGLSYRLPLDRERTMFLAPELFYTHAFTPLVTGLTWNVNTIRAGLALLFSPRPAAPPPPPPPPPPPAEKPVPVLAADVQAFGLDSSGVESPNASLRIEEFIGTQMKPLLPYVFFDENSAVIPPRYVQLAPGDTGHFTMERLHNTATLPTYHQMLNIIGRRMRTYPAARIQVTGCNADEGDEKQNTALSRQRAMAVKNYLETVWEIPASRIEVAARNLPLMHSTTAERDGVEENRRAEISSQEWEIIKPVITTDTPRVVTRSNIRFRPSVRADAGLASWRVDVTHDENAVKVFSGSGPVPATLDWDAAGMMDELAESGSGLQYTITATDRDGRMARSTVKTIAVDRVTVQKKRRERIADKFIDKYALILFDFDKSEVRGNNRRIMDLINGNLQANSVADIAGYTDRIGENAYNRDLSMRRAQEVATVLQVVARNVDGVGEETLLYDNNLPEGRTYSRTVIINVETPVGYEK